MPEFIAQHPHDFPRVPDVTLPQKPRRFKKLLIAAVPLILLLGFTVYWLMRPARLATDGASGSVGSSPAKQTAAPTSIRLIATGDWIAHDSINAAAKQADGSYNYLPLVNDFKTILQTADIRFCNDPILNGGESLGISGYPKFNSPTEFVTDMGKLGCNVVNSASNHSFDFTQANIDNSVKAWAAVPNMLAVAGENQNQQQHDTVHTFTVKGLKFAFLAYSTYSNVDAPPLNNYGVNVFSQAFAASQIAQAKVDGAQFIIVSIRWGTEYTTTVNAEQQADAQFLASQGVNLVLGHGSHELQPVQKVTGSSGNQTVVWYSIGNFLNTQEPPETLFNGLPIIDIDIKSHQITNMRFLPTYMHYEWTAAAAAADNISTRHTLHMYLLENATQSMLDAQQLHTTIAAQQQRLTSTLSADGLTIPLITSKQL